MRASKLSGGSNYKQNVWENYRPVNSINFSDIIEDETIYDRSQGRMDSSIESSKMIDQRNIDPDALSVDDILGDSVVHEIRDLSRSQQRARGTSIGSHLPSRHTDFGIQNFSLKESFKPSEEVCDQLLKDEKDWAREYADIPPMDAPPTTKSIIANKEMAKAQGKLSHLSDFSTAFICDENSSSIGRELSMGQMFLNRCIDVDEIFPNAKSPKMHRPVPLVDTSQVGNESTFKAIPHANDTECNKNGDMRDSVMSLPTIASHLDDSESPETFLSKLYSKKNQALLKENAKLLEKTAKLYGGKQFESKSTSKKHQQKYNGSAYERPVKDSNDDKFNYIMNSTKIDEKENQWQNDETMGAEQSVTRSEAMTCSPIKYKSPPNVVQENNQNKRMRSPTSVHESQFTENQSTHMNGNDRKYADSKKLPQRLRSPAPAPLDNVTSLINNMRLTSSSSTFEQVNPPVQLVRRCASDLKASTDHRPIEELRQYSNLNRSPDAVKLSLPNYGLHGMRNSAQIDKRCNSQCSTNSEFTPYDGKFPLKANTSELVWECVRLRKNVEKSFVIKNTSDKKLYLKIGVTGPGYQIATPTDSNSIVLHGHECRTISVMFCPTMIGKAIGKITFKPSKDCYEDTERSIHLWAYGGSTVLQLMGIERGPVGSSFLKMGESANIDRTTLERTFTIYNKGPLNGFATIFVKPKTNQCISENHISIEPNRCIIRPECSATVKVAYKLRRKDLERLSDRSCEVLTIGTLEVIFGAEPNRQRIATILTRNGNIPSAYKQLEFLVNDFPTANNENFRDFREHIDNVSNLFGCFRTTEIALTINRTNLDESRNADLTIDDSVLFRTLIETPKQNAKSKSEDDAAKHSDRMWSVSPKFLTMDLRTNPIKTITIQNFFDHMQTFQVNSDIKEYLHFSTRSGRIMPNSDLKFDIKLNKELHIPPLNGTIVIYIESDSIEIPIRVEPVPYNSMT